MLIGIAVPAVAFGRSTMAVIAVIGLIAMLLSDLRPVAWARVRTEFATRSGMLAALTIAVWEISALGSNFQIRSSEAVLRTGLFGIAGIMVFAALRADPKGCRTAVRAFVIASAITAAFCIIVMTVLPNLYWLVHLKGWHGTKLQTELKGYTSLYVMIAPVLVWALFHETPRYRLLAIATLVGGTYLVWATNNRAAIAGFLAMGLAIPFCWMTRRSTRKYLFATFAAAVLLLVAVLFWLRTSREWTDTSVPKGSWLFPVWLIDFQRQTTWEYTLEFAARAPWFGIGANTINFAPGADSPMPGDRNLHIIPAHPHNWSVELLAETGAVGLIAMLAAVGAAMLRMLKGFRHTGRSAFVVAVAIVTGYFASGLFNFSYWAAWWQVSFFVTTALALALPADGEDPA